MSDETTATPPAPACATHRPRARAFRAAQFTDAPGNDIALSLIVGASVTVEYRHGAVTCRIPIPNGDGRELAARPTDWVVVDDEGRVLVTDADHFAATYEEVPAEAPADEPQSEPEAPDEQPAAPKKKGRG